MNRKSVLLLVMAFVCFGLGVLAMVGARQVSLIGGPRYDQKREEDLVELRRLAYSFLPVVEALQARIKAGGGVPETLKELPDLPAHFAESFPLLHYVKDGGGFVLYYKIGWDAYLRYSHSEAVWIYDPGDGGESTVIKL